MPSACISGVEGCCIDMLQDMHYAEFAEDEVRGSGDANADSNHLTSRQSAALLAAIKEYEASKWKVIGQKLGKPAKVSIACSQKKPRRPRTDACIRPVNNMPRNILGGKSKEELYCFSFLRS